VDKFSTQIARISSMTHQEIVDLHFAMHEEIKSLYKPKKHPEKINEVKGLCEKSVSISAIVIHSLKKKHRAEADEYARIIGKLSPHQFSYPAHAPANTLCAILRKQGDNSQADYIERKMTNEGWGTQRYVDLLDL